MRSKKKFVCCAVAVASLIAAGCNITFDAVNTYAGEYTNVDYAGGIGDPDTLVSEFFSRQITAIDNMSPVIAIVNQGFHAGVIDGGSNHLNSDTGLYIWDSVYFNDPVRGGGLYGHQAYQY